MKRIITFCTILLFIISFLNCAKSDKLQGNDGRTYKIVTIGDQIWMAENLQETLYRNGDPITVVESDSLWAGLTCGARCVYGNDEKNADIYGFLYNWHAVSDERNIAPEGWRVATSEDWSILARHLGGIRQAGGKLKSEGTEYWASPNTGAADESGFSALPSGLRGLKGDFNFLRYGAFFWTSSTVLELAVIMNIRENNATLYRSETSERTGGAVRLVKE